MVKNPAPAPAGFAIEIQQNPAPAGFGKSKSGTTLKISFRLVVNVVDQLLTK